MEGAGLCERCAHARRSENKRGSVFWQCRLAETDPRFRRYPELPVHECAGFEPVDPEPSRPERGRESDDG